MVLVTGATGFLGSHLIIDLLENGEDVRGLYRNINSISKTKSLFSLYKKDFLFDRINWVLGDINDIPSLEIAFQNIEYVYHCAALITFEPKKETVLRKINIEGTANIVNFCLEYKIKKLCHVSSIAALGDLRNSNNLIDEMLEWNPEKSHSDYAISKYGAEMEIWRGQQEGLNVVIVNPGVIIGAGFWENGSGKIFSTVSKGILFYTKGTTGFVAVNDVTKIMLLLMKREWKGERFIIVSENIVFRDLINNIAAQLKVREPQIYAKKWMTDVAWRLDWLLCTLFFKKRKLSKNIAKSLHAKDFYSNEKIKKQLDYNFIPVVDCVVTTSKYFTISKD